MRILIVEDDLDLNRQLTAACRDAGYVVDSAYDGEEGHFLGDTEPYDAVILDIGLPKMDGLSVLEAWRRADRLVPVLLLTARDRWSDKVAGIDAGADDYVAKPFSPRELAARVKGLLRRATPAPAAPANPTHNGNPFHDDVTGQRMHFNGQPLALTRREYRLLSTLLAGAGRIHSRDHLLTAAWGDDSESTDRTIDTHIKTLRAKLRTVDASREYITTHRGMGYCFELSKE